MRDVVLLLCVIHVLKIDGGNDDGVADAVQVDDNADADG